MDVSIIDTVLDATMALHNEGAVYILQSGLANGIIEPPREMEQALLEVCRLRGCIGDELGDIE